MKKTLFKIIFSLFGAYALYALIQSYGWEAFQNDLALLGWNLPLLCLTFIPTLFCYSLAWIWITRPFEYSTIGKLLLFNKIMVISIAWNNLTPFFKIGGEPLKVLLLEKYVGRKEALRSVAVYNIIHILGTVGALVLAAVIIPIVFDTKSVVTWGCIISAALGIGFFYVLLRRPTRVGVWFSRVRISFFRIPRFWASWLLHKSRRSYRSNPKWFFAAVWIEIVARFAEGITFYFAFKIIERPIGLATSGLLEVARMLIDNIFFFIPYQVGSREAGLLFFLEKIFGVSALGYLAASMFYRLVELVWIVIGYIFWITSGNSRKS